MQALIIFRDGAARSNEVVFGSPVLGQNDLALPFDDTIGDGDRVAEHYTHENGALVYSPPEPVVVSLPNLAGLMGAIMLDMTIPAAAHEQLMSYLAMLQAVVHDPDALRLQWGRIKIASVERSLPLAGNCTDGTPIVQKVEAYAAANNVQLTEDQE